MDTGGLGLFTAPLGLGEPWRVTDAVFAEDTGRLDLHVGYPRGTDAQPGLPQMMGTRLGESGV